MCLLNFVLSTKSFFYNFNMKNADKILVVDDDLENIDMIVEYFEQLDQKYTCFQAHNGAIACKIIEDIVPDLVLIDWNMPKLNGLETVKILKKNPVTRNIPIIMMTGVMEKSEHLQMAFEAGVVDYLRKPFELLELRTRINSTLSLAKSYKRIYHQNREIERRNQEIQELYTREKDLLSKQLEQQYKELYHIRLQMERKNETLSQVKQEMKWLEKALPQQGINRAKLITRTLEENLAVDKDWEKFKYHAENVPQKFFATLTQHYPHLTKNDLKLCAYISLQLSNKEMAALLRISDSSVKMSRNRLKKKLNLGAKDNLTTFILQFMQLTTSSSNRIAS